MLCMCFVQVALACCDVFRQLWFYTVSEQPPFRGKERGRVYVKW